MFIRVTRRHFDIANIEAVVRVVWDEIIPGARRMPGFKGFRLGVERESGRFVAITAFETREQTEAMNTQRPAAEAAGFDYGPPDVYELVAEA